MPSERLSRREMLTGLAAASVSALSCTEEETSVPRPFPAPPIGRPRNLVVLQAYGGWDTTYSIDPKPDSTWMDTAPGEVRLFGGLPLWFHSSRPSAGQLFARHHERLAVLHGINVRSVDHTQCLRWMLTGTRDPLAPDLCAIVAAAHGNALPIPYLLLSDRAFLGEFGGLAARAGGSNQIAALADPEQGYLPLDGTAPLNPSDGEQDAISAWRVSRRADPHGILGVRLSERTDTTAARERAAALRTVAGWLGTAGVPQNLEGQIQTTLTLLEGGLTRAVTLDSLAYFDTHGRNEEQMFSQEEIFQATDILLTELASRPGREGGSLLDETIVAVVSEMGRAPVLNANAGKDHWPFASILLAGGGIIGDTVYGATDEEFLGVSTDLTTAKPASSGTGIAAENVVAGLLAATGVDPAAWLPSVPALHGFYRV